MDAVDEYRGIPDDARACLIEAFSGVEVTVQTRWGPSRRIPLSRGVPQGSVSGPELAKPAQEPVLRRREHSEAFYVTSAGRRVSQVAYVDDGEHYGSGAADLPVIVRDLGAGSLASGIGFAWAKFSAFARDWDAFASSHLAAGSGLEAEGIRATGWDIWNGGPASSFIVRSTEDDAEKLLGKRGTFTDKYSLAAADTIAKLKGIRTMLQSRRATWDESAAVIQLMVRGVVGYAPLVGIPQPPALHAEDAAFLRIVNCGFGGGCV